MNWISFRRFQTSSACLPQSLEQHEGTRYSEDIFFLIIYIYQLRKCSVIVTIYKIYLELKAKCQQNSSLFLKPHFNANWNKNSLAFILAI